MNLTASDLQAIRQLFREEIKSEVLNIFQTEGKAIIREQIKNEVMAIFQTEGKAIIHKEICLALQTDGREIIRSEISKELVEINTKLDKLESLENDIKEIYFILDRFEKRTNHNFLAIAGHVDIKLPYNKIN